MTGDFVAAWMPSLFIPLAGVLGPAVVMVLMFNLIEATPD
ncbi:MULTISPECIES: photosystem I reaction center subunit VIII [unclassified Synechococcus]|nr:MAG: Photosystem I reaction center subunit VIII [Cyanobium sp. ARS6]